MNVSRETSWQAKVIEFADESHAQAAACAWAEGWVMQYRPDLTPGSEAFYRRVFEVAPDYVD